MTEVMNAREIDALIAELAMGLCRWPDIGFTAEQGWYHPEDPGREWATGDKGPYLGVLPHYSTDPAASYQLRQKMRELGWDFKTMDLGARRRVIAHKYDGKKWLSPCADSDTEMESTALACCAALGRPVELKA